MKLGIIIQARMGSTRLPEKILKPFWEKQSIIDIILDKLHRFNNVKIIVATTTNPNNNKLVEYLTAKGEIVYRGSEDDVLDRFISAAETNDVNSIIRICSDNPFLDYESLKELINFAKHSDADYIGFKVNNTPSIKTHFGFWGEYVTLKALKKVASSTNQTSLAHEHVTIEIYSKQENYKCQWLACPDYIKDRKDIRLTIDTEEDFKNAQEVYNSLKDKNENFTIKDIVDYLDQNEQLLISMKKIINLNKK